MAETMNLDEMKAEQEKLEELTAQEDFWGELANSQKVLQRIATLKNKIKAYEDLAAAYEDGLTMIELSDEEELSSGRVSSSSDSFESVLSTSYSASIAVKSTISCFELTNSMIEI